VQLWRSFAIFLHGALYGKFWCPSYFYLHTRWRHKINRN